MTGGGSCGIALQSVAFILVTPRQVLDHKGPILYHIANIFVLCVTYCIRKNQTRCFKSGVRVNANLNAGVLPSGAATAAQKRSDMVGPTACVSKHGQVQST